MIELAGYTGGRRGGVRLLKDLEGPIDGRDVILVEDVVDTGLTLGFLTRTLRLRSPASLAAVCLLDRPYRRLVDDVPLRYVGFTVPDELFAGYGLGLDERWRALPDLRYVPAEALPAAATDAKELEEFLDVCDASGEVALESVTGTVDLATHDGRFTARILGAVAKKESDDKSRRIRRKHEEIALAGGVSGGGSRPFGYEADKITVRPDEAAVVRECVTRLLAGEAVRSICASLNERCTQTVGRWLVVAADATQDVDVGADQRPTRAQRGDRRPGVLAGDHHTGRDRADPRPPDRPGPQDEQERPPLPARQAAALRPVRHDARLTPPPGRHPPLRLRQRPRLVRLRPNHDRR